ncbi:MAG TPA: 23S rRNA (adenine(2030)-N(6))-methyltransferase RlmJ [Rhizomicrobium sp.]|nr:23S rRNA (adenine(2030)-N(6))-methyltransferase RlmJ [Rhizomicrobium sp.]
MNYRHSFHAGNFADVVKHVALVAILLYLRKKESPFAVIDTHAGRGLYDLSSDQAQRTGEAENGIEKVRGLKGPEALEHYLALVEECGKNIYPGSPLLAAKLLRPQDRLVAIEKHPEDAEALRKVLAPFRKARAEEGDGYTRLLALLPPPERRGLVLIDPPFEAADEFEQLAAAVSGAVRRFATGITLIWYPIKSAAEARAFAGEVMAAGHAKVLSLEAGVAAEAERLGKAGLLVLNPPYGFDAQIREIVSLIASRWRGGNFALNWLRPGT